MMVKSFMCLPWLLILPHSISSTPDAKIAAVDDPCFCPAGGPAAVTEGCGAIFLPGGLEEPEDGRCDAHKTCDNPDPCTFSSTMGDPIEFSCSNPNCSAASVADVYCPFGGSCSIVSLTTIYDCSALYLDTPITVDCGDSKRRSVVYWDLTNDPPKVVGAVELTLSCGACLWKL